MPGFCDSSVLTVCHPGSQCALMISLDLFFHITSFKKRLIYLESQSYRKRETKKYLPSSGLFPRWLQRSALSQAEARSHMLHEGNYENGRNRIAGHLLLLFLGRSSEAGTDVEQSGHKMVPIWNITVTSNHNAVS